VSTCEKDTTNPFKNNKKVLKGEVLKRRGIRKSNREGKYDQSMLFSFMEISQ
jgi:hypothetical protein